MNSLYYRKCKTLAAIIFMKSQTPKIDKGTNAYSLIVLGYRDYIAARFLLNNNFIIQGLTLSSTAIEKYLKALIVFTSKEGEYFRFHFDKLDKLKEILDRNYYDITKKLDQRFLGILEKIYKIRYYDNITEPITIGFFLNQFIGELDLTVNYIENVVLKDIRNQNGEIIQTPFKKGIESRDQNLYENNFVLNQVNKKEFMERPDNGFAIHLHPNSLAHGEIKVVGTNILNEYSGGMWEINVNFERPENSEKK